MDRETVWTSTLQSSKSLHKKLKITFKNEDGLDLGGLTNEWLELIRQEILNPSYGFFKLTENGLLVPNHLSVTIPNFKEHFICLGRVIGKCLLENLNFKVNFCKLTLKQILRRPIFLEDIEEIDPLIYKSLTWVLTEEEIPDSDQIFDKNIIEDYFSAKKTSQLELEDAQNAPNSFCSKEYRENFVKKYCEHTFIKTISVQTECLV